MKKNELINIRLSEDENSVIILDQTALPNEEKYLKLNKKKELFDAIYTLQVRGAPAIGIFAAYSLYVLAKQIRAKAYEEFLTEVQKCGKYLDSSRPTAVNLNTQLTRMIKLVENNSGLEINKILEIMKEEAVKIHNEDIKMCRLISEHGLTLIKDGFGIMTQCNAGPIATSKYGTGLGPLFLGQEKGMKLHAYINETRPLLQGARLTAFELNRAGINCTLICDNMASIVMSEGKVDAVFAGCDRVAANGDTANKVGTSGLAILASYYKIPFYIFCPSTTIDINCESGEQIEIEQRKPEEIKNLFFTKPIAPEAVNCYNPAFDITPNELITAIITENGIFKPKGGKTKLF